MHVPVVESLRNVGARQGDELLDGSRVDTHDCLYVSGRRKKICASAKPMRNDVIRCSL